MCSYFRDTVYLHVYTFTQYGMINFTMYITLLCIGWEKYATYGSTVQLFGDNKMDNKSKADFCG